MLELARSCGVEVPITAAVNQVLEGRQTVVEAIEGLMARGAVDESNL
jgi:glycerol-3-phosphate dehydrogenase